MCKGFHLSCKMSCAPTKSKERKNLAKVHPSDTDLDLGVALVLKKESLVIATQINLLIPFYCHLPIN